MYFELTGRARIALNVTIEDLGKTCVEFQGVYVAIR